MVDIHAYLHQLYQYIKHQDQRIEKFEKIIEELRKEIQGLKEKPPINVERLEYKFDQLKIERLDGTLNIGLNPSDLSSLEDMEIPTNPNTTSMISDSAFKRELTEKLNHYVENNIQTVIHDTQQQLGMTLDQQYHEFIVNDLQKQIPQRVDHYINVLAGQKLDVRSKEDLLNQVFLRMKADIDQAIFMFVSKLPTNQNGENISGT